MIDIIIADDHAIVRRGLRQIVEETADMRVSAEAADGNELLEKLRSNPADVAILDITMPGKGGLETLMDMKSIWPSIPVLVLSVHPEEQYAMRVLKAGAAGYINKESAANELISAIRKVHSGGRYISSALAEKIAFDYHRREKLPHEYLSDREFQVMIMLARGNSPTSISEELNISIKTVSTYRSRILDKMQLRSNADLTHYCLKNNLIE
ncbi:MAG: response regulator [Candidatus Kapaibacterium sp.]